MRQDLDRADEAMLDLAWSLWSALGASSWQRPEDAYVIEVEPLLAFTAFLEADDGRLRREVTSWVAEQMPLLSLRQFKNVVTQQRWPFEGEINALGAAFAEATGKPWPGRHDRTTRGLPSTRGDRPATVDMSRPCALQLRLRALLGVSARAEIVRVLLLADQPMTVSELAERVSYTRRQVRADVDLLVGGGFLRPATSPGAARYSLTNSADILSLVGPVAQDVDWAPVFRVLTALRQILSDLVSKRWREPEAEIARRWRHLEPQRARIADVLQPLERPEDIPTSIARLIGSLRSST